MRQANGTIVVYPIKDMIFGRMYKVAIKGLDGKSKHHGLHRHVAEAHKVAKEWAAFTGFPIKQIDLNANTFWLGVGVQHARGRGQFELVARTYADAQALAEMAGLGAYPIQGAPFNSLPVHGVLEF